MEKDIDRANQLLITPDMTGVAGCVSYWRLPGACSLDKLTAAWKLAELPEKFLPKASSEEVALYRAVADLGGRRRLVRPLARRGAWAIVEERVLPGEELRHDTSCTVHYTQQEIFIEPPMHPYAMQIHEGFARYQSELSPTDISSWLIKRVQGLQAVCLRDSGGVYFVPRQSVEMWRSICGALESVCAHKVFRLPAMKNDEAAAAILDAIVSEAEGAAAEMEAELVAAAEEEKLGPRALGTRAERCRQVLAKVGTYESLLGVRLDALRARLGTLQGGLAAAALASVPVEDAA